MIIDKLGFYRCAGNYIVLITNLYDSYAEGLVKINKKGNSFEFSFSRKTGRQIINKNNGETPKIQITEFIAPYEIPWPEEK